MKQTPAIITQITHKMKLAISVHAAFIFSHVTSVEEVIPDLDIYDIEEGDPRWRAANKLVNDEAGIAALITMLEGKPIFKDAKLLELAGTIGIDNLDYLTEEWNYNVSHYIKEEHHSDCTALWDFIATEMNEEEVARDKEFKRMQDIDWYECLISGYTHDLEIAIAQNDLIETARCNAGIKKAHDALASLHSLGK